MIDRRRFAGTVLIVAVCTLMTLTAITQACRSPFFQEWIWRVFDY